MKKAIFIFSMFLFLMSCGGNDTKNSEGSGGTGETSTKEQSPEQQTVQQAEDPAVEKGLELIAQSDCLSCHKVADKLVGPAYEAVAAKYPNTPETIDMLAGKIITGGAGNWGEIPMTAHPALSKEDAQTMVKYIMSLKK